MPREAWMPLAAPRFRLLSSRTRCAPTVNYSAMWFMPTLILLFFPIITIGFFTKRLVIIHQRELADMPMAAIHGAI